ERGEEDTRHALDADQHEPNAEPDDREPDRRASERVHVVRRAPRQRHDRQEAHSKGKARHPAMLARWNGLSLTRARPCSNNRGTRRHFGGAREPWQSPGGSKASTSRTATARFCVPVSWGRATREAAQRRDRPRVTATYPWSSASSEVSMGGSTSAAPMPRSSSTPPARWARETGPSALTSTSGRATRSAARWNRSSPAATATTPPSSGRDPSALGVRVDGGARPLC